MSEIAQGYRDIPEEDQKKANVFFDRGRTVADTGNYEYAIEMYLQGLSIDPENVEAHQALREISLKRMASGGKDLGMFEKLRLKRGAKEDKQAMLTAEKLLAYRPGDTDQMLNLMQSAHRAGFYDTVLWIGPILQKANADSKNPDFNKFIALKDIYKDLRQWKLATDACHYAAMLRPDEMELQTELKNLGAQHTMDEGKYGSAGSFRRSMRDANKQDSLLEGDRDVHSEQYIMRAITEAEAEYNAEPNETGKIMKYVEALLRTEQSDYENRAVEVLQKAYDQSRQFRFRQHIGRIRITQLERQERQLRAAVQAKPTDEAGKQRYLAFLKAKAEQELAEYSLWAENYPTDMRFRYEMARRMFLLEKFSDSISVFQQARTDPKYRVDASVWLGRAFLSAGFLDEAIDTLRALIDEYQLKGDNRSKEMYYWYGMALEQQGRDLQSALKSYSQVAQWDFNYRDVQGRIKKLRAVGA